MTNSLNKKLALLVLAFATATALAAEKEDMTVISSIPSTYTYNWSIDGTSTVSCYGNSCYGRFTAPREGTSQVNGATLKLQFANGDIVTAECVAKVDVGVTVVAVLAAVPVSTVYRDCRVPPVGVDLKAEFLVHSKYVKLVVPKISWAGQKQGHWQETYRVTGWFRLTAPAPVPAPAVRAMNIRFDDYILPLKNQYKALIMDCGSDKSKWSASCTDRAENFIVDLRTALDTYVAAIPGRLAATNVSETTIAAVHEDAQKALKVQAVLKGQP